jgi:O-antigen ligase
LSFVEASPIIGHGTGSIAEQFRNAASAGNGASSVTSVNPHNQIFAVAIQLGLVGAVLLAAMWAAHAMLFRGTGIVGWIGMLVVLENVGASLFNSHLFDFSQGWFYVFGVGVAGGTVLRDRTRASIAAVTPKSRG